MRAQTVPGDIKLLNKYFFAHKAMENLAITSLARFPYCVKEHTDFELEELINTDFPSIPFESDDPFTFYLKGNQLRMEALIEYSMRHPEIVTNDKNFLPVSVCAESRLKEVVNIIITRDREDVHSFLKYIGYSLSEVSAPEVFEFVAKNFHKLSNDVLTYLGTKINMTSMFFFEAGWHLLGVAFLFCTHRHAPVFSETRFRQLSPKDAEYLITRPVKLLNTAGEPITLHELSKRVLNVAEKVLYDFDDTVSL